MTVDEEEYIYNKGARAISEYFTKNIIQKRNAGLVPVLVKDYFESLYYLPCNKYGMPLIETYRALNFIKMPGLSCFNDSEDIVNSAQTVEEISVQIRKPLVAFSPMYRQLDERPYIFLWQGEVLNRETIPFEKLNVKELSEVVNKAIEHREGLVIDEALSNKIYK